MYRDIYVLSILDIHILVIHVSSVTMQIVTAVNLYE